MVAFGALILKMTDNCLYHRCAGDVVGSDVKGARFRVRPALLTGSTADEWGQMTVPDVAPVLLH